MSKATMQSLAILAAAAGCLGRALDDTESMELTTTSLRDSFTEAVVVLKWWEITGNKRRHYDWVAARIQKWNGLVPEISDPEAVALFWLEVSFGIIDSLAMRVSNHAKVKKLENLLDLMRYAKVAIHRPMNFFPSKEIIAAKEALYALIEWD